MKNQKSQEQAYQTLRDEIRVAMIRLHIDARQLAEMVGRPYSTVTFQLRHPEKLTIPDWQLYNAVLRLDPATFNAAAGFVRRAS